MKKLVGIFGVVLGVMSLAWAERGSSGELSLRLWQAVSTLNPYLSKGAKDFLAAGLVLESLAGYDSQGNLIPQLATHIPTVENGDVAEDLTSITWTLKEGLLWSDGTRVTAEDVLFSAEYCLERLHNCPHLIDTKSIEALDSRTIKITFTTTKPFPYVPFVGNESPILQKAQFGACNPSDLQNCTAQDHAPIGTGPFKVRAFYPDDRVLYAANPHYRDPDKPYFATVVLQGEGDARAAARAVLETGEVDWAWNIQIDPYILLELLHLGKGTLDVVFGPPVEQLIVNFTNSSPDLGENRSRYLNGQNPHPILSDVAVRQALSLAIDRDVLATVGYGPLGRATCNILPAPVHYNSHNNDRCLVPNIERAKDLLEEAGWLLGEDGVRYKDGQRLSLVYKTSTNHVRQTTQKLVQLMWRDIGVEAILEDVDGAVFFGTPSSDMYKVFHADIEMFTNTFTGTDPESYLGGWRCSKIPDVTNQWQGANISRFCSEEYDKLIEVMAHTASLEQRIELAIALNDMLVQNYAVIPLVHRGNVNAYAHDLVGVEGNAWDSTLWNIAEWSRKK